VNEECDHGCTVDIPDDHPISSFMDTLFTNAKRKMHAAPNLIDTFPIHPEVWENENNRKIVLDLLVSIGTNLMLSDACDWDQRSLYMAVVIVVLEHYDVKCKQTILTNPIVAKKRRDLYPSRSIRRDALKFYRKRITCKCLKKMHLEARKTIQKRGVCNHCREEKDRELLQVCGRCMVTQYCSKECQATAWVAAWPGHKKDCDFYVKAQYE